MARQHGSTAGHTVAVSDFLSHGTRCAGRLYLPHGVAEPPVVIMAHGFALEQAFGLGAYAERFVDAGMAAFVFDYRNFGESDGRPRNLVDPRRHVQDWRAALAHVRSMKGVGSGRIALWGTSFAGGHVIVTAAREPGIGAVVSQVGHADGLATIRAVGPRMALHGVAAGLRDLGRALTGREPYCVPVVAAPGTYAAMNTPDALPGYMRLVPPSSAWRNEFPARGLLTVPLYRPIAYAARVRAPALIVVADGDSVCPPEAMARAAARMPNARLVRLPIGHFDVYAGEVFEQVVRIEVEFLAHHLLAG